MKIDLEKIKLVIWDLDETLWKGTLSEGEVSVVSENIQFIKDTTDAGIVHSICSKNDYDITKKRLEKEGVWSYFVFPSINWESKGVRLSQTIKDMGLRPVNVLFIDDNIQNLKEAEFYSKELKTTLPSELNDLYIQSFELEKKDLNHKRLNQYKVLENKHEASKSFSSNEEFLLSSGIKVDISKECHDYKDRIFELMARSNQLNYTKFRQTREEFELLMGDDSIEKGIVKVADDYGDYGVVGFFAVKNNIAIHYFFSCRTLGMLVEQYVYMMIGCPEMEVVGEVVTPLNKTVIPPWINNNKSDIEKEKSTISKKILFKGPCDLLQMYSFIKDNDSITNEFTFTNNKGILVEGLNHTASIVTSLMIDENEINKLSAEFRWVDKGLFHTSLRTDTFDYVFLSLLTDGSMGIYKHKESGYKISVCEKYYDITNPENWNLYESKTIYDENISFTKEEMRVFSEKYEFVDNSNWNETINNLTFIRERLPQNTKLVLLLGSEKEFSKDKRPSFINRHMEHYTLNRMVEEWKKKYDNVMTINYSDFIDSENDYVDSIDHFVKRVYYEFAKKIVNLIEEDSNESIKIKGKQFIIVESTIAFAKRIYNKLFR